ncbi:MAG: hypothetical protein MK135_05530 [Polyangiaceae bacterium]|nr:hypothetical protein [Polyangiaceae bacterium]
MVKELKEESFHGLDSEPTSAKVLIAERLEEVLIASGYRKAEVEELVAEAEALERPPGLLRRLGSGLRLKAKAQWQHIVGELEESKEAMALLSKGLAGGIELTREERDKVRAQLLDVVKVFPAGLIAAANSALPVPGTGLLTPWILARLGLMPTRWREAHLLDSLERRKVELLSRGDLLHAEQLKEISDRIESETCRREALALEVAKLSHWDENGNGVWDNSEKIAYSKAVLRVSDLVESRSSRKEWYIEKDQCIFGAIRLSEVLDEPSSEKLLISHQGKTGWVLLADVRAQKE